MKNQKGVSLYLTLMIMTIFLAMSFGISVLLLRQLEMVKGLGDSIIALYAADTGIERELYEGNSPPSSYSGYIDLNNNGYQDSGDATYNISVIAPGPDCSAENFCIRSIGLFKTIKRAIEAER